MNMHSEVQPNITSDEVNSGTAGLESVETAGFAYQSASITPDLVGNQEVVADIRHLFHVHPQSAVVYIVGVGGTGKTRLLQHVLKYPMSEQPDAVNRDSLVVTNELIDLYHTRNRSIGGLIESLLTYTPKLETFIQQRANPGVEENLSEQLTVLERAEQEGVSRGELLDRRQDLTRWFIDKINEFTTQHRLVIALDTAERLFVAHDIAQGVLGLATQRPPVLEWLLHELLPTIQNTVILLAGRPEPLNLTDELQQITTKYAIAYQPIKLSGLHVEDTLEYFQVMAKQMTQRGQSALRQPITMLDGMSEEEQRALFYCLHDAPEDPPTSGEEHLHIRPILLALAIDHLAVAGQPLPSLKQSVKAAQALSNTERRSIEEDLGRSLVQVLREHRRPADDIILTLAWLRKGATVELLAALSGYMPEEVTGAIAQISDLSFVKIRPADNRIFLHDEIYDLLQRYDLATVSPVERKRIYRELQQYYETLIADSRRQIDELYQPEAETDSDVLPNPVQVRKVKSTLQDAMSEDIYYRLQWDAGEGYQQYYLYTEEAIANNDDVLYLLLRAELFGFIAERDPEGELEEIDGLRLADVIADSAVRWIVWYWSQEDYTSALQLAERLAEEANHLIAPGGPVSECNLKIWYGYLHTYTGGDQAANQLLTTAVEGLRQWGIKGSRTKRWAAILARSFFSLGYYYDRQTEPYAAIEAYQSARQLWSAVKVRVEEANTLNNLGFAWARVGVFSTAFADTNAGLRIREQLGPRTQVGLSINTLALIQLASNELTAARRYGERALRIFERIYSLRGQGLAYIALAEATRRASRLAVYLQQGESANLLQDALTYAKSAELIFQDQIQEPNRQFEALREKGRIYRTWLRLRVDRPRLLSRLERDQGTIYSSADLVELSEEAFDQAYAIVENDDDTVQRVEILLDKTFLFYYASLHPVTQSITTQQSELIRQVEQLIPSEFHQLIPVGEQRSQSWRWVQMAILEILKGHILFRDLLKNPSNDLLSTILGYYLRGLTFHRYFRRPRLSGITDRL